jgi:hypothetical protein
MHKLVVIYTTLRSILFVANIDYLDFEIYQDTSILSTNNKYRKEGEIVGSSHKNHIYKMQKKNLKILCNIYMSCIYNSKKSSAKKFDLHLEK